MAAFGQAPAATPNPGDIEVANAATDGISCVQWSPTANFLAVGSWDHQIRVWDVQASGQAVPKAATSHDAPVLCAAWSSDGARVFTGSCDKTAKVWDLASSSHTQVAAHDAPIKNIFWVSEINMIVTSSWDKTIKYWDGRSGTAAATLQLPERPYCMDIRYPLMVIATADRKIVVVNLSNPSQIFNAIASPLKYQSRCIAAFPDQQGFCLGSIEGRVAVHHVNERDAQKNFAFKCHRETNDIYAVNDLKFHPTFGTFATTGSDGTFNFWDKDSRQRLKAFNKESAPIPCGAFNREGNIYAYAVSYDWSKGSEHYNPRTNRVLLHSVPEAEIKSRNNTKNKSFGARR